MSIFSYLKESSSCDDFYDSGPWAGESRYLDPDLNERLHKEIIDLAQWLEPTIAEQQLRLLVITRFTKLIEELYKGCVCIPQGSSATGTYLPTSDIDLIVLNLPPDHDTVEVLRKITKAMWKAKVINNALVLDHANVPIAKLTERPFGFKIDICASNINGALNIPRVRHLMKDVIGLKQLLMFLKFFIYSHKIDDPSVGGFGSNQLLNIAHFAFQSRPDITDLGSIVLYLFDVIANKLNFFLTGISTVNGGRLFSKRKLGLLTPVCPQSFVCEDPQFRDNFIGMRTSHTLSLITMCKTALHTLAIHDYTKVSSLMAFMPLFDDLLDRREELERLWTVLQRPANEFARITDDTPKYQKAEPKHQPNYAVHHEEMISKAKKKEKNKNKQKAKKYQTQAQQAQNMWQQAQLVVKRSAKKDKGKAPNNKFRKSFEKRNNTPPRFKR